VASNEQYCETEADWAFADESYVHDLESLHQG
jgi:hypothetical protein